MNLAKTYDPNQYEPAIYGLWEKSGAFEPTGEGEPFSMVMPPLNANGNMHVGHALIANLQDILIRYNRMQGKDVVYIPGADHAGFETWVVYEKELERQGKSRFDFSREQLYSQVWNFVDQKRGDIDLQLRAHGVSASWKHSVFTLDEKVITTVYDTFQKMWSDGLIYRGERIVNYCTKHQTSFADIEVVHKQEKGKLYKIAYPTLDKIGEIVIATTRPETLFADEAIAVNPDDERYKHLIGTRVLLPLVEREIPIIADDYADAEFGTGAVKITPGHDPNDFEVGVRHALPIRSVIGHNGLMMNTPAQYAGKTIEEARRLVIANLEAAELLRGHEEIEHSVGHCYKCDTVLEPLVKDQWFISVKPLAQRAIEALEQDEIAFTPASKKKVLFAYLENLKDWNISRQIPWGIPIPAFQNVNNPDDWIFDTRVADQTIDVNGTTYRRDEDTFDTWFSSGQWPFITTDYLQGGELSRFYPLSAMMTGADILYSWVSRMIMLGLYRTDTVPFKEVYLNGLVLDERGQKMSKSKGNVINPVEVIAEYGSDALRLGIIAARSAGQNQAFSKDKVVAGRNFCNKLWNITRFISEKLGENYQIQPPRPLSLADHWVIERLNQAARTIETQLNDYRFAEAADTMYHTIWDEVADWYIEASKIDENLDMLAYVLDMCLTIAHPFAPFVTETIWQTLSWHEAIEDMAISTSWPEQREYEEISAAQFTRLQKLVEEIRFVTAELPGNKRYDVLYGDDSLVEDNAQLIQHLSRAKSVVRSDQVRGLRLAASGRDAWLDIDEDTLYEHQTNLEMRLAEVRAEINRLEARLANESYVSKAPEHLVEESRKDLERKKVQVERLHAQLDVLN